LQLVSVPPLLIILAESPPELNSLLPDEQPSAPPRRALPACFTCQAPMRTPNAGDRTYLDLIMKDIRLRGLAVAGREAAGPKSPHNRAQTAQNL
jgi:hypothetical protein